ncbi:hypothetical protein QTI66_32795 [Variovorax sp. J22R133]|uniref:hypothetical protein n=1 Tax=Variovorax brevis TaxID=3053503 RepID=UPI0025759E9C|nr:hypothetical protein [Variovorax sp. J22R133]MDM0116907.1 hypothetical protein [Variovorax sp. J22R133]
MSKALHQQLAQLRRDRAHEDRNAGVLQDEDDRIAVLQTIARRRKRTPFIVRIARAFWRWA